MDYVEGKKSDDYMTCWVKNDILAFLYAYFSMLADLDIIYVLSCANSGVFLKFVPKENDKPLDFPINPINPFIGDLRYFSPSIN